jgi:hypothetical protein
MPAPLVGEGLACGAALPTGAVLDEAGALFGAVLVVLAVVVVLVELPVLCMEVQPPARVAAARSAETAKSLRMILSFSLLVGGKAQSARPTLR